MPSIDKLTPRELSAQLREWIDPIYAMMIGTESHERKVCADAIDSLLEMLAASEQTADLNGNLAEASQAIARKLMQQYEELQQARAICPNCSLLIDKAAGVDVAAKNQRIAELEQSLAVLRDRVQDEFDQTYISGVLGK